MMGCSGHEGKKPRKWLLHPQGQHAFGIRSTSRERGSYVSTCAINRFITALGYSNTEADVRSPGLPIPCKAYGHGHLAPERPSKRSCVKQVGGNTGSLDG